jgi:hypothetical protein
VAQESKAQSSNGKNREKQKRAVSPSENVSKSVGNIRERKAAVRDRDRRGELRTDKKSRKKQTAESETLPDEPPAIKDCEWSATEDGWHLLHQRAGKKRYSGHLSRESWEVMKKDYDHQAYFKQVEERLRRHSGR